MPAKKSAAKKRAGKKSGAKRERVKRVKKARAPMSKDSHLIAAKVAGLFTTEVIAAGGTITARDSKGKDAVQVTGKFEDRKLALRIAER